MENFTVYKDSIYFKCVRNLSWTSLQMIESEKIGCAGAYRLLWLSIASK